ncbi:MAG TPA: Panacea domain-containing protein [Thermoanaerobaculia bacterium]|nr:Panacea domain-containing protein [Thermoanaerobaculia bacterium]
MQIQTDDKMRELILYLAARSEADPRFSSTKLNKLLFYCDFGAYQQLGHSITGHSYRKLQFGPAPKAMLPILEQMKGDRECAEIERDHFGRSQRRVVALRSPDVALFSAEELRLADSIVEELWESNATAVSDLSHDFIGWKVAALNEIIPYETVFVGDPGLPVSEEEVEFCRQLSGETG